MDELLNSGQVSIDYIRREILLYELDRVLHLSRHVKDVLNKIAKHERFPSTGFKFLLSELASTERRFNSFSIDSSVAQFSVNPCLGRNYVQKLGTLCQWFMNLDIKYPDDLFINYDISDNLFEMRYHLEMIAFYFRPKHQTIRITFPFYIYAVDDYSANRDKYIFDICSNKFGLKYSGFKISDFAFNFGCDGVSNEELASFESLLISRITEALIYNLSNENHPLHKYHAENYPNDYYISISHNMDGYCIRYVSKINKDIVLIVPIDFYMSYKVNDIESILKDKK